MENDLLAQAHDVPDTHHDGPVLDETQDALEDSLGVEPSEIAEPGPLEPERQRTCRHETGPLPGQDHTVR